MGVHFVYHLTLFYKSRRHLVFFKVLDFTVLTLFPMSIYRNLKDIQNYIIIWQKGVSLKKIVSVISIIVALSLYSSAFAGEQKSKCSGVYTIGDISYDKSLENGNNSIKLGPIPAEQVPPIFPKSFLEADGSYGGGVVYCSAEGAIQGLNNLLQKSILPKDMEWHIYELEATWEIDVYELNKNDFRLKNPSKVKSRVN